MALYGRFTQPFPTPLLRIGEDCNGFSFLDPRVCRFVPLPTVLRRMSRRTRVRALPEDLEARLMLAAVLYVDDNYTITNDVGVGGLMRVTP